MTTSTMTTTLSAEEAAQAQPDEIPALGVPVKFLVDGTVQPYPGNTTVCHIPANSPILPGLRAVYDAYRTPASVSSYVRLLPPSSWHMTVLDGVRERECEPGMWSAGQAKQPLVDATARFSQDLREFGRLLASEGLSPPYKMRVKGFEPSQCGMGLEVEGATAHEGQRLRRLRDRLADVLGFRAPNHDRYAFHITVAYLLRPVTGEAREELQRLQAALLPNIAHEFDLGAVEFCTFSDMEAFDRHFYLGD